MPNTMEYITHLPLGYSSANTAPIRPDITTCIEGKAFWYKKSNVIDEWKKVNGLFFDTLSKTIPELMGQKI